MKRKHSYIWPTIIAAALAVGIFVGGKLHFNDTPEKLFTTNSKKDKLNRLIDYIDYEYVDEIDTDSIVDVTVNQILEKLDPHSVYIPKNEMDRVSENMKGDFVGIGINFYPYKDTIAVIRTIPQGPSYLKGIKAGDAIMIKKLIDDSVGDDFTPIFSNSDLFAVVNLYGMEWYLDGIFSCLPKTTGRSA